jgi:intracellular sulfur oxidation DsrE/DsrF family protein
MKLTHALRSIAAAALLAGAAAGACAQAGAAPAAAAAETRVVYHVSEVASMRDALNNITNHLATQPAARITLLANARGVYGLVNGERDRQGDYLSTVSGLQAKGVKFVACSMSMKKNNIADSSLLPGVSTVQSGVVELTRLQAVEQHAYIKP